MKLAVCLFGLSYYEQKEFWGHRTMYDIDWRYSLENYKEKLYDFFYNKGYTIDFYLCTNDSKMKEQIISTINPKAYLFVDNIDDKLNKTKSTRVLEKNKKVIEVLKMVKGDYDTILLTRFDLHFKLPLTDSNTNLETINIISVCEPRKVEEICDNFYIFPYRLLPAIIDGFIKKKHIIAHRYRKILDNISPIHFIMNEKSVLNKLSFYYIVRIDFNPRKTCKNWGREVYVPKRLFD